MGEAIEWRRFIALSDRYIAGCIQIAFSRSFPAPRSFRCSRAEGNRARGRIAPRQEPSSFISSCRCLSPLVSPAPSSRSPVSDYQRAGARERDALLIKLLA